MTAAARILSVDERLTRLEEKLSKVFAHNLTAHVISEERVAILKDYQDVANRHVEDMIAASHAINENIRTLVEILRSYPSKKGRV